MSDKHQWGSTMPQPAGRLSSAAGKARRTLRGAVGERNWNLVARTFMRYGYHLELCGEDAPVGEVRTFVAQVVRRG